MTDLITRLSGATASWEGLIKKLRMRAVARAATRARHRFHDISLDTEAADALIEALALCREAAGEIERLRGVLDERLNIERELQDSCESFLDRIRSAEAERDALKAEVRRLVFATGEHITVRSDYLARAEAAERSHRAALTIIGGLLARIFRDDGHKQEELGLDLAAIEADKAVVELLQAANERDAALARVAELKERGRRYFKLRDAWDYRVRYGADPGEDAEAELDLAFKDLRAALAKDKPE